MESVIVENKVAQKSRIEWLDISKGVAIILMIVGHVSAIPWAPYRKIIFSFHMPLFFIASGYVSKSGISVKAVKKLVKQLALPCVLTLMFVWLCRGLLNGFTFPVKELYQLFWSSGVPAVYGPGKPIFASETYNSIGALWFLLCLLFSKLVYCLVFTVTRKSRNELPRGILFSVLCALGYTCGQFYKLPFAFDIALFCSMYLYIGYLMKKYSLVQKSNRLLCMVAMAVWAIEIKFNALELSARKYGDFPKSFFVFVGSVAGVFIVFVVVNDVFAYDNPILLFGKKVCGYFGRESLHILCAHVIESAVFPWAKFSEAISSMPKIIAVATITSLHLVLSLVPGCAYSFVKGKIKAKLAKVKHENI